MNSVAAISAEDALGYGQYGEASNLYTSPHNFVPDYKTDDADMQLDDIDVDDTTDSPMTMMTATDPAADLAAELPNDSGLYDFTEEPSIDEPILKIGLTT